MFRMLTLLAASGAMVGALGGCASQSKYDQLDAAYRSTLSRNQELEQQLDALRREIDMLSGRIGESDAAFGGATETNAQLRAQLMRLRDEYRALEERLNSMGVMLNPETDAALRALAEQFPDLITYDARRGMLRFKSDLTFASGSAEVRPAAQQSLQQLASALNNAAGAQYDLRIVGHTDNVQIANPATLREHRTNTHLSAHRAISVRDVLANSGVNRQRMEIAGWGEYRPTVANRPGRAGTEENRRVEIFVVPSSAPSLGESSPAPAAPAARPAAPEEIK